MIQMDILDGGAGPKRGDLVQTNIGDRRERTWLVLHVRKTKRKSRYQIHMARWWDLEVSTRVRLFKSAERNGGQRVFTFYRYPVKKKQTFEEYMRR